MSRLIPIAALLASACAERSLGGTCIDNSGCGPGEVCGEGVCTRLCVSRADCPAGHTCSNDVCVPSGVPEITEVNGNGTTPDIFADALVILGRNLADVQVTLGDVALEPRSAAADSV